jgi:hypothetical protein
MIVLANIPAMLGKTSKQFATFVLGTVENEQV